MLHHLNDNSLLLLYLADELSAGERAALQRRLAENAGLRAELEQLDQAMHALEAGMARLDHEPMPGEASSMRRIGSAMRQHLARQAAESPSAEPRELSRRVNPRWLYWGGAAAAAVSLLAWWGHQPPTTLSLPSIHKQHQFVIPPPWQPEEPKKGLAEDIHDNFDAANYSQPDTSVASLELAAEQLAQLTRESRSAKDTSYFGFDGNE